MAQILSTPALTATIVRCTKRAAKTAVAFAIVGVAAFPAMAAAAGVQTFFISGLLQKIGEPTVVKLVHTVQTATSLQAAEAAFKIKVQRDFPEFSQIDTISSPQSDLRAPECLNRRFGTNV